MAQYTLIDPVTGDSSTACDEDLTRYLQLNVILFRGNEHVGIITHRDLVSFCRWCAEKTLAQYQTVTPEAHIALELVDRWLIDPGSVTSEDLYQVAEAAWAAARTARTAALAARAAAWAAFAARGFPGASARDASRGAKTAGVSYEDQALWFVEHLKSSQ